MFQPAHILQINQLVYFCTTFCGYFLKYKILIMFLEKLVYIDKSIASYQLPVTNCQMSAASYQLSDVRCQLPVVSCQMSVVSCQLPTDSCQLPVTNCQLSVTNCQLQFAREDPCLAGSFSGPMLPECFLVTMFCTVLFCYTVLYCTVL